MMDLPIHYSARPLTTSNTELVLYRIPRQDLLLFKPLRRSQRTNHSRRKLNTRVSSSSGKGTGSAGLSWSTTVSRSIRRGADRFLSNFGESVRETTGLDFRRAKEELIFFIDHRLKDHVGKKKSDKVVAFHPFISWMVSGFMDWNKLERWEEDVKNWESKRIGAFIFYIFVVTISCRKLYVVYKASGRSRQRKELTEAYMEAVIPEPSPNNIRRFKKSLWRAKMPKGLRMKKFIEGPDGLLVHDNSYIGEDAWSDDSEQITVNQIIKNDVRSHPQERKELDISGPDEPIGTWRERLYSWKVLLRKEKLAEIVDYVNGKYVVDFDMPELEKSLHKDVVEKVSDTKGKWALWISKRWWRYRPNLPYTYFLHKLDSSEVAAVVFSEDLKKLYITMKEGFPSAYVVNVPLDPYLFEIITSSGAELDLFQGRQINYVFGVIATFVLGILILWLIRESVMILHITSKRYLYKKYNQLPDMADAENFIMPNEDAGELKSMNKDVVLGGDVWDLIDKLMVYMQNPMQYYEKEVQFARGILLSGPPGTGKTLFARTLAKKSGVPFVFASAAEFTNSEKSGAARINELFSLARRHAPSFVFVDEIDAIAGRHTRKDPRREATYEALIAQLDGDKEKTGIGRFSLRQAVVFICATNRPDELDLDFICSGRIDHRLYIGLPDAKQRVQIFGVHSAGKLFGEDVNFGKLVFRTIGYSGADIRNLVNEACIMAVRKGHSKIFQQDIVDVLDKQLLEGMGVSLTEEEQRKCEENVSLEKMRLLAVHEAGHILLAHLFPRFDWHAFSQLLPGGKETAISVFYPKEDMIDQGYTTFGYLKMQMVVAHGGRCAERIVFGNDITDGGTDDIEKITQIAREMVISPRNSKLGLTKLVASFGEMGRRDNSHGEVLKYKWDDPRIVPVDMMLEVSELFTRELTTYIEETEEIAMRGLKQNAHILDLLIKDLLEKSRITGLEVEDKMKSLSPIMFEDFI